MIKVGKKIEIEIERDNALRCHEYYVVSHDRKGNEVQCFSFKVRDSGTIHDITPVQETPTDMAREEIYRILHPKD